MAYSKKAPFVFGVGLPKTGTNSLGAAMAILGCPVRIWLPKCKDGGIDYTLKGDDTIIRNFHRTRLLGWVGWPIFAYERFFHYYPNALWIQTTRRIEDWVISYVRHVRVMHSKAVTQDYRPLALMSMVERYRLFGTSWPEIDLLKASYDRLNSTVSMYLKKRKVRLLEYALCDGAGWGPLCEFLETGVPPDPLPCENVSPQTIRARVRSANKRNLNA